MRYRATRQPSYITPDVPPDSYGTRPKVDLGALDSSEFKQFAEAQAKALREHWERRRSMLKGKGDE